MNTRIALFTLMLAVVAEFQSLAADQPLRPGWSFVSVRVVEEGTGYPVAGASIGTTCGGSPYFGERQTTDTNGFATVPIYRTWVGLRVSCEGYTNSTVELVGSNEVSSFCTNAVVKLRGAGKFSQIHRSQEY